MLRTGAVLWRYDTGSEARSTPTVAGGVVYVGSNNRVLNALDAATGAVLWRYWTLGDVLSTPAVAEGTVYVGSEDGYVYALNAATGKGLWRYKTGDTRYFLSGSS